MAAYFIVNCTINDMAKLTEYVKGAGAAGSPVPVKVLAMDNESETVEGTPAGSRTVVLEFASKDDFQAWYNAPGYQAVLPMRLEATTGFAVLVNGL